ncbi:MAG TPA: hypothetical protein VM077_02710 [Candidatus Limnocylindrales bacterium]|nr:hypothetical protein [Candidatus Limnocylindrales bacterium]
MRKEIKKYIIYIIGALIICVITIVVGNIVLGKSVQPEHASSKVIPKIPEFLELGFEQKQKILETIAQKDPQEAWNYLKHAVERDKKLKKVHELAHVIGNEAYKKNGFQEIAKCSHDFGYACYHGITEQMFLEKGPVSIPSIENECIKIFQKGIKLLRCVHGLGHGLITYENQDAYKALSQCEQLKKENRESCYIGVYMGYTDQDTKEVFDEANPWKFCSSFSAQYQRICATFIPTLLIKEVPFNEERYKEICSNLPELTFQEACKKHVPKRVISDIE